VTERRVGEIEISSDPARLDLSNSYWAAGRPREVVAKSLANSLCFGAYDGARQVGLARVVTDRATFAYLCDVYVEPEYRGRGVGKRLMAAVAAHPELQGLRRFHLVTRDAQGLYAQFGFTPLALPERHMERVKS
jgi:ribosomal protein S18 acetylase RimI-like enzyme